MSVFASELQEDPGQDAGPAEPAVVETEDPDAVAAGCVPDAQTLCLSGGRYRVQTTWRTKDERTGSGTGVSISSDTGYFWFFKSSNVELVVKVLNACASGHYWTFGGGLTSVQVTMTVTDTQSGKTRTYTNPLGKPFQPIQDTTAFETCP